VSHEERVALGYRPGFGMTFTASCDSGTLNLVRVELPEVAGSTNRALHYYVPTLGAPPIHWQPGGPGVWRFRSERPNDVAVEGLMELGDEIVNMTLSISNLGERVFEGVGAGVCVQLAAAPSFRDPERRRTVVFESGSPVSLYDIEQRDGFRGLKYLAKGAEPAPGFAPGEAPPKGQEWARSSCFQPDEALVCVASPSGQWTLGLMCQDSRYVFTNPMGCLCCIHADPVFGEIRPGQSVTRRGWIVIVNAPPEEARRRLLALRSG